MKARIFDYPTRIVVTSESREGKEYTVDLGEYPLGLNEEGFMVFNGACGLGRERFNGCKHFIYHCEPRLKDPANKGKIFRCKHIAFARENCIDFLIPTMLAMDPNHHEDHQT